jgi:hypothetical protein
MSRDLSGVSAPYTTMIGSLTSGAAFAAGQQLRRRDAILVRLPARH